MILWYLVFVDAKTVMRQCARCSLPPDTAKNTPVVQTCTLAFFQIFFSRGDLVVFFCGAESTELFVTA